MGYPTDEVERLQRKVETLTNSLELCVNTLDAARNHVYDDARKVSEHMHQLIAETRAGR